MKNKLYEYTLFLIYCQKMHFYFILLRFTRSFYYISYICVTKWASHFIIIIKL
jgi:hypothetical protein